MLGNPIPPQNGVVSFHVTREKSIFNNKFTLNIENYSNRDQPLLTAERSKLTSTYEIKLPQNDLVVAKLKKF